jgi:magnesium transporter
MRQDGRMFRGWKISEDSITDIVDPASISDCLAQKSLVWVDLIDPTSTELELLREEFGLHPLSIKDVEEAGQRPKLEVFKTHAFIVGYAHDDDPTDLPEVELFVADHWLISVRSRNRAGHCFDPAPAREFYERVRNQSLDVSYLLYALLDDMVDGYFDTVDAAEERIAAIEEGLFTDQPIDQRQLQKNLYSVRRTLIELRRHVAPMRDVVLQLLRREVSFLGVATEAYFQDVLDRLLRVIDGIDVQRELLGSVVDAQLALQANRMNKVMKKMTSWGAILIAATLIAGIYGMNFKHMPELGWELGYPGALASMLVVTSGLYVWFRHKDWL